MKQKGTVLVIGFIIMGVLMVLAVYFLGFTITESRISRTQTIGTQAYYLAEAGINEAIWKLKYDTTTADGDDPWAICFVSTSSDCTDCNIWQDSFASNYTPNSTTTVSIQNSRCTEGKITATSTVGLPDGKTVQRVVKTGVFKTIGGHTAGITVFSGGGGKHDEMKIESSIINVSGNVFSNHDIKIERKSEATVEGKILAVKKVKKKEDSTTTATAICADNICNTTSTCGCPAPEFKKCEETPAPGKCPHNPIDIPRVDFYEGSNSYKNQAQALEDTGSCEVLCKKKDEATTTCSNKCVFDWWEFAYLLWFEVGSGGTMTLNNDITYVKDSVWLEGGKTLVINGVLVSERNIKIGKDYWWKWMHPKQGGDSRVIVNNDNIEGGKSSGLLARDKIEFGKYAATTTITGLLYANKEIKLRKMPNTLTVEGGIMAKKIRFEEAGKLNVTLNDTIIGNTLGEPGYSPVITIEHWEEEY